MKKSFDQIALTFSGGGFRAAGYSLGTLSLLEHIGLLDNVKAISSVSGGSITAVKYAQSQIDRQNFDQFFGNHYSFLKKNQLADLAIRTLGSSNKWNQTENNHKRKNPINAFSIQYNELTCHRTFADLDKAIKNKDTHLERIIINATDFNNGLPFRFQNTGTNRFIFGNKKLDGSYDSYYEHIKLGDALAASSAFPGGFEPMQFPNDYVAKPQNEKIDAISLMDGGIIDNQGTSSLLTGSVFSKKIDLFIVSDVSSATIPELKPTERNWLSYSVSFILSLPMLFISIVIMLLSYSLESRLLYSLLLIIVTFLTTMQLIMFFISKKVKNFTGSRYRLKLPYMSLGVFLLDRINSLVHMTTEVSLQGFRRANASTLHRKHGKKTISSMIYELRCRNIQKKPEYGGHWEIIKEALGEIPESIKNLSTQASSFGTTLWFNDKKDIETPTLDTLIACGEVTLCFNLLSFLIISRKDKIKNENASEYYLYKELIVLWDIFKIDPYYLVAQRTSELKGAEQ